MLQAAMLPRQMDFQLNSDCYYKCKKHNLEVKYFCVEIQVIDSLLCELCYQEKHKIKNIKVLLFEMIYHEVQKEISCWDVEDLLAKCTSYIDQVSRATSQYLLYSQNQEIVCSITKKLNKSYEILNRLEQMKYQISDKIWSSYFVQAIKNRSAITVAIQCLGEVEQNIEQIKKGYFSYQGGLTVTNAFLLGDSRLLIQESSGSVYIYDSNNLQILCHSANTQPRKFSKAISAFSINQKKIGVLMENANLFIYKVTFDNKLVIQKKIKLNIVPQSIQVSKNFIRLEYKIFSIVINTISFKILSSSNSKYHRLLRQDTDGFLEIVNAISRNSKQQPQSNEIFKDKKDLQEFEIHTSRKCLTCLAWICQQSYTEKKLLKYRNCDNQLIRIYKYGVRI